MKPMLDQHVTERLLPLQQLLLLDCLVELIAVDQSKPQKNLSNCLSLLHSPSDRE